MNDCPFGTSFYSINPLPLTEPTPPPSIPHTRDKPSSPLKMASRWGSFRKEVYGFLNFRPYQHDATPSPAVVLPASPVPPTGPSLTSLKEELSILREELTTILSEQDGLIGEYNISHNTIHDIQRHLIAVASTPPPYSYDDTWYLRNSRDAELRKMEGLTVKMAPLAQILRALLDQVSIGVDVRSVDTE